MPQPIRSPELHLDPNWRPLALPLYSLWREWAQDIIDNHVWYLLPPCPALLSSASLDNIHLCPAIHTTLSAIHTPARVAYEKTQDRKQRRNPLRGSLFSEKAYSPHPDVNPTAKGHSLAIISMVGYRVRQPAGLVIQAVVLRDQPHSNGAPDTTVHDRYLRDENRT